MHFSAVPVVMPQGLSKAPIFDLPADNRPNGLKICAVGPIELPVIFIAQALAVVPIGVFTHEVHPYLTLSGAFLDS